jgi:hypothetical protein
MKANISLGTNITLEIDERDEMETLHKAIVLSNPIKICNVCRAEIEPYFTSNKDKEGNVYVNAKCPSCGARSKLGRYKVGGYFWHEYEKWEPKDQEQKTVRKEEEEEINPEDIPF